MSYRSLRGALVALVATISAPALAHASRPDHLAPAVIGTVKDSAGRPLPNASVLVVEAGRVASTNELGEFVFRGLPAGIYHITATLVGYKPGHADAIITDAGPDVKVAIIMNATAMRLASVVVSASPTGGDADNLTQAATELSGKTLNRNLGTSIAQTLASEPGLAMRFNGPAANAPIIRGLQGDRILVLQDGERTGDLSSAAPDHAVSIDPLAAQRIEVVRGPASLLYGNNALGGVVNVISNDIPTSVPSHVAGSVAVQGESVNPGGSSFASVTAPMGDNAAFTLRGGFRSTGDLKTGGGGSLAMTQARSWNGSAGVGFTGNALNGGVVFRKYDFSYGLPSEAGSPDMGTHINGNRSTLSGRFQLQTGAPTFPSVNVEATSQRYQHDELSPEGAVNTAFNLKTQTVNVTANTRFGRSKGTIGFQGLYKQYASTGDEALTPAANSTAGGAFFYQDIPLTDDRAGDAHVVRLQFGGRFDSYKIASKAGDPKFGPATTVNVTAGSGSIGLSIPLADHSTFSVSAARAFRAPTVEELFANAFHAAAGTYDKGNRALSPETNMGFDAILRVNSGTTNASISGYYNKISKFVVPNIVKDTLVDGELQPLNNFSQADATLYGIEGSVESAFTPRLVGGLMGDMVHGELVGRGPVPFMPPARVGASLRWDDGKWSFGGDARHAFKQDRVSGGSVDIPTDAYTVLNTSTGYQIIRGGMVHSLTLRVDNLTDARFYDASSRLKRFAPNPGRNLALVYKVLF